MSKSILLPIDLNNDAINLPALTAAQDLLRDGGVLHVVSVMPDMGLAQVSGFFKPGFEKEALDAFGQRLAEWVNQNVPEGQEAHPHVLHGTIYDEILRAADKLRVDVIVIGSHRPELKDYLLGPNAARVVRHANQSVYVVRT
ncbi:Nucleotide-binding universal stress protein, UspA family [Thalassovita litoralis]|jgi:nucleotide-binding universal stress UspA family protein|uniref:Nucleotide-binding universal stress protein, UspA family n=1 Tax=Thalassovita litoralis TaxID=1010611 RepID=A0A521B220_9RHOB|nr:universal stress protein [Thalassovita litoralis]SMO41096.1 Nucleotide-binding universal stress protein, UspA family [Thalassovita litoralis]